MLIAAAVGGLAALLAAGALMIGACASVLGIESGILESDGSTEDVSTSMSPEAAAADSGAAADATSTEASACSLRSTDSVDGLFVLSSTGNDNQTCGSPSSPCATVSYALSEASMRGKTKLFVGPGTYVESIALFGGLTIEGAWDVEGAAWSPDCTLTAANLTSIEAPADASVTITADNLGGSATLRWLTVLSKEPAAVLPGESIYGISARGASTVLTLDTVVATVTSGGNGSAGEPGSAGAPAGTTGCSPADGGAGLAGELGTPSDGGTFTSAGWVAGPGGVGGAGRTGSPGTLGEDGGCQTKCSCLPGNCGGFYTACAQAGQSGCGGEGGAGGHGGAGGGSSIALYVWGAEVTCVDAFLTAASGGNGGAGGVGGEGGAGSQGAPGAELTCAPQCGVNGSGCVDVGGVSPTAEGGAAGGRGGPGGAGGVGGGGAGGWACAYYVGAAGAVTATATSLQVGEAGAGGGPGGVTGIAKGACP